MSSKKTQSKRNYKYVGIYYKRNGQYVGPWLGQAMPRQEFEALRKDGWLKELSNYVLRSPLKFRYQTVP